MASMEDRFEQVYEQGSLFGVTCRVLRDKQTGVQYLFAQCGQAGGLTPLLDREGRPVITPIAYEEA